MAFLASLPGVAGPVLAVLAGVYLGLIVVMSCTAVFSRRPTRRRAAYAVLVLLWPTGRKGEHPEDGPALDAAERRARRTRR
ncbi:hypothetical protein ACNTMW_31125 [Planosporangium sp. 12N6]|uniref:hypothetical protein n=1 Tax=Planosporangium spinosum TaxID=3402278 RepID=UPI003CF1EDDE